MNSENHESIPSERILTEGEVQRIAGNPSHSTLWRWQRIGVFPRRRKIGPNRVGWLASEVEAWLKEKASEDVDAPQQATAK